ncbi:MAG TPA: fluoride efflux transporter CrcB [Candidatus Omnitrophota bacterium]|nr:fluoride efflux transporter CrcB [Candidatus Omnitrophota bacterium]HPS36248.1 fluoride efflux transporter CrcB [Candidatus Omnitrophota bacterium]
MTKWFSLILGGALGTIARYLLAGAVYQAWGTGFPYGTLIVNLSGCWLIGLLAVLSDEKFLLGPDARILLMIGFCGAYTTFSTFMLETANLMKDGQNLRAFMNILLSVVLGFLALRAGILTGKLI